MKNKTFKQPKERLETLASVAGRNVVQSLIGELLEIERRLARVEEENRRFRQMFKPSGEMASSGQ